MDLAAAILDRQRIDPHGARGHEIVHGEHAAQLLQPLDQFLAERAAIHQRRAVAGERLQGGGQVGLSQHGAERRLAAADSVEIDAAPFGIELLVAAQFRRDARDFLDVELDQTEAVTRQLDRGREQLGQLLPPVAVDQGAPAGEIAG